MRNAGPPASVGSRRVQATIAAARGSVRDRGEETSDRRFDGSRRWRRVTRMGCPAAGKTSAIGHLARCGVPTGGTRTPIRACPDRPARSSPVEAPSRRTPRRPGESATSCRRTPACVRSPSVATTRSVEWWEGVGGSGSSDAWPSRSAVDRPGRGTCRGPSRSRSLSRLTSRAGVAVDSDDRGHGFGVMPRTPNGLGHRCDDSWYSLLSESVLGDAAWRRPVEPDWSDHPRSRPTLRTVSSRS